MRQQDKNLPEYFKYWYCSHCSKNVTDVYTGLGYLVCETCNNVILNDYLPEYEKDTRYCEGCCEHVLDFAFLESEGSYVCCTCGSVLEDRCAREVVWAQDTVAEPKPGYEDQLFNSVMSLTHHDYWARESIQYYNTLRTLTKKTNNKALMAAAAFFALSLQSEPEHL